MDQQMKNLTSKILLKPGEDKLVDADYVARNRKQKRGKSKTRKRDTKNGKFEK